MKGMKGLVDQLPDELSGTALWQSVSQGARAKDASGGRIKLAASKAKDKNLQTQFLRVRNCCISLTPSTPTSGYESINRR